MAGESNQRISWWKFKSKGSPDNNDDEYESPPPTRILPPKTNSPGNVRPSSVLISGDNVDPNQNIRDLRDQFLQNKNDDLSHNRVFGVELEKSLDVASAKISVSTDNPDHFFEYGKIPIVVAKCGAFLKHNGLSVEGIFRVGGSSKRVKQLQYIFSSPPDFGKKLDWDGYTVHDAASLLRRFLNSMPEPVIPLDQYEAFRAPLKSRHRILKYLAHRGAPSAPNASAKLSEVSPSPATQTPSLLNTGAQATATPVAFVASESKKPVPPPRPTENVQKDDSINNSKNSSTGLLNPSQINLESSNAMKATEEEEEKKRELEKKRRRRLKKHKRFVEDINGALQEYERLVQNLPILRKQLLLYILDLLELFSQHSAENRMSSANLSAVFQPSVLSHPKHDMSPDEYVLSQRVVEFLVEYSYKLLPQQTNKNILNNSNSRMTSLKQSSSNVAVSEKPTRPSIHTNKIKSVSVDNFHIRSPTSNDIPLLPPKRTQTDILKSETQLNGVKSPSSPSSSPSPLPPTQPSNPKNSLKRPKRGHSKSLSSATNNSEIILGGNSKNGESKPANLTEHEAQITTDDESNSDFGENPDGDINSKHESSNNEDQSSTGEERTPTTPLLTVPDGRRSRWDESSKESFDGKSDNKKDKWYKRLRSRSRSANGSERSGSVDQDRAGSESK